MDSIANFLHVPVEDATRLTGRYDIDLHIPAADGPDDTPEYRAAVALAKLGLKLDARKVNVECLVVDSAARTPTEN